MTSSVDIAVRGSRTDPPVLTVRDLRTHFDTPAGPLRAVDGVSFDLFAQDILAVVGESGSGKSMMALSIMNLVPTPPGRLVSGSVKLRELNLRNLSPRQWEDVRGRRLGMIFQNPRASLHPSFTVMSQMIETLRRHDPRLRRSEGKTRVHHILEQLGFADPVRIGASYPHNLSGGMCQRIGFALCLAGKPEVMFADEPTTALDVVVQATLLLLLTKVHKEQGVPIVFITHDFGVVKAVATRVLVMYGGLVQEEGPANRVLESPRHPYSRALIACVPHRRDRTQKLYQINGQPPDLSRPPQGCRFSDRCNDATALCHQQQPDLIEVEPGIRVRCHLYARPVAA